MEQTAGVVDVTDFVPSPLVLTVAVNPPPKVPLVGRFVMVGVVGVAVRYDGGAVRARAAAVVAVAVCVKVAVRGIGVLAWALVIEQVATHGLK